MPVNFADIGGSILLAEDDDGIQGVIWGCRSGTLAFSDYLAVTPEFQGSGLGARLALKAMAIMRRLGVRQVRSWVHYDNHSAIQMNLKLGVLDGPYAQVVTLLEREEDNGN
jgi:GNAT superfamily N-acetyltransferase